MPLPAPPVVNFTRVSDRGGLQQNRVAPGEMVLCVLGFLRIQQIVGADIEVPAEVGRTRARKAGARVVAR